jgi:hypothetical protein
MKIDVENTLGWLQYEVAWAMTQDDLNQLRLALSLAAAHGINMPIIEEALALMSEV